MKENKKFSPLELEEQVELDSLVLEEGGPTGELIIEQYLEDTDEQPTGELVIEQYLEDDEEEPYGELIIEKYLEDAEGEPYGELIIDRYLEDVMEQQTGPLDELAKEIELTRSATPERDPAMAAEIEETLLSISRTLEQLINETDDYVQQKLQADYSDEHHYQLATTPRKEKQQKEHKDTLVPDLYAQRDWYLVTNENDDYDHEEQTYTDSVLPSLPPEKVTEAKPPEKKSLGSLSTALLAGGGVLVFGLVTAGVVTAVKSYREKSKQQSVPVWNESNESLIIPTIQPVEQEVEQVDPPKEELPEPPPANHYVHYRPPVIPLFGFGRPCHWKVG